jgi:hypothetical protein
MAHSPGCRLQGNSAVRTLLCCTAAALGLAGASCGNNDGIYPVSGKVTYKGQPASGAAVSFRRQGGDASAEPPLLGVVRQDGSFVLLCGSRGQGAPPGEYDVLIEWKRAAGEGQRRAQTGTDRLKGRYADPKRPLLHAVVTAEPNALPPFELTD